MTRALIGFLCALSVLSLPCLAQTQHYNFTYPDRTSFLAAGWDFLAVSSAVVTRNTEQTTGAVVTYDVAPGILQIPVDSGDLWSTQNDSRNTVFRSLPTDWTSMRLSLSFAPTTSYQQLGLVAYRDDDNYVNITRIFNGANQASFAVELAANPSVVNSATVTATTFYLRLDRDLTTNTITGSYSLDGVTWVQVSSTVMALNDPQLAIFARGSPSGLPNAKITWAQVITASWASSVTLGLNPTSVTGGAGSTGTAVVQQAEGFVVDTRRPSRQHAAPELVSYALHGLEGCCGPMPEGLWSVRPGLQRPGDAVLSRFRLLRHELHYGGQTLSDRQQ